MSQTVTAVSRAPRAANTATSATVRLGSWELVRLLGEGSWTSVYQARPLGCTSASPGDYAIKMLKRDHWQNPVALELLRREAEVAKSVSHSHLVPVLSSHLSHRPHYVVMPRLNGATVRAILDHAAAREASLRTPMLVPHTLWIARQVADALMTLHAVGWVHGDVKPSNIFVSPQGHATLIDLGFAQRIQPTDPSDAPSAETEREMIVGTPAYAAPEVFEDHRRNEPASDIYSLGATLFEMFTGERPFVTTDSAELAACHQHQPAPDPRRTSPQLLPRVVRLLQRMLDKDPTYRPAATELRDSLVRLEIETLDERAAS